MFQYGSSTLAVIAAVSRLALSNLFFLVRFIAGEAWEPQLSFFDVISLVILVLGIVVYSVTEETTAPETDRVRKFQTTMYDKIIAFLKPLRQVKEKLVKFSKI